MMAAIVILALLSVLAAALFVRVNEYGAPQMKLLVKGLASLLFVLLGAVCAARTGGTYAALLVAGLVFGAAGDVLLQLMDCRPREKEKFFRAGLGAFLLGHLFYIVAFGMLGGASLWAVLGAAALFALLFCLQFPLRLDLGAQKLPVYLYAAVISLMAAFAVGAAGAAGAAGAGGRGVLAALAGLLFVVSDAILALIFFSPLKKKRLPAWNLITYYAAQILLALSIALG